MNWLAQMEAKRLVLSLREMLVRFDENVAANTLMAQCVPYILEDDPEIARARAEQALKVKHITDGREEYSNYYATNGHEKPFEEQYLQQPEEAHEYLHRVKFLRDWLIEQVGAAGEVDALRDPPVRLFDVACNDGWMAQNLADLPVAYDGIDLNPDCIARAKQRQVPGADFMIQAAERAPEAADTFAVLSGREARYDVVVAFELVEHVKDPDAVLAAMAAVCKPGGSLFVSTPLGACTGGDLPHWWVVEPAGHVRAFTPRSFHELLSRHGHCEEIIVSEASVGQLMVARVTCRDPAKRRHVLSEQGFGAWETVGADDAE